VIIFYFFLFRGVLTPKTPR